jgi:hypothetical protein
MGRVLVRCWSLAAVLAGALAVPKLASAQVTTAPVMITVPDPGSIKRVHGFRSSSQELPFWTNLNDCLDQNDYIFNLTLTTSAIAAGNVLQVWATTSTANCYDPTIRSQTAPQCWLVFSRSPNNTLYTVTIPAQGIVAQKLPSDTTAQLDGNGVPIVSAADCTSASTLSTHTAVTLYFMVLNGSAIGGALVGQGSQTFSVLGFDVTPPSPPAGVNGAPGENRILLNWQEATDTDTFQYQFYCDPPPGRA